MPFRTFAKSALALCALGLGYPSAQAELSSGFEGRDLTSGKAVQIDFNASDSQATVLVFLSARCPCSQSHESLLSKLSADFPKFRFVGVHSNVNEKHSSDAEHFKKAGLNFPVLSDPQAKLANELRAFKTPHAFVIGRDQKILYQGGVTDTTKAERAKEHPLRAALEDLTAGRPVRTASYRSLGCVIARK